MAENSDGSGVDLVAAFTRLQSLTLSTARVSEFLSELVAWAPQLGGPALCCSITLRGEQRPYTVTSSDDLAVEADEMQYERGDGPCLEALRDSKVIYVQDIRRETRWNGYPQHAVTAGVLCLSPSRSATRRSAHSTSTAASPTASTTGCARISPRSPPRPPPR